MAMASGLASLGDWMGFLAIIALTADIMGPTRAAAFAVSGVMAARVVPSLVLAPVAGVFVDRWDRKRVLVITARRARDDHGAHPVHAGAPRAHPRDAVPRGAVLAVRAGEGRGVPHARAPRAAHVREPDQPRS
jgi:hypothetical protein